MVPKWAIYTYIYIYIFAMFAGVSPREPAASSSQQAKFLERTVDSKTDDKYILAMIPEGYFFHLGIASKEYNTNQFHFQSRHAQYSADPQII